MRNALIIAAALFMAVSAQAQSFTNLVSYTNSTTTLNSTSLTAIVSHSDTNTTLIVPGGGVKIANTNSSGSATVYILWNDGNGINLPFGQVTISGPSGVFYLPIPLQISETNQTLKAKMDATETAPLDITIWSVESTNWTP